MSWKIIIRKVKRSLKSESGSQVCFISECQEEMLVWDPKLKKINWESKRFSREEILYKERNWRVDNEEPWLKN